MKEMVKSCKIYEGDGCSGNKVATASNILIEIGKKEATLKDFPENPGTVDCVTALIKLENGQYLILEATELMYRKSENLINRDLWMVVKNLTTYRDKSELIWKELI